MAPVLPIGVLLSLTVAGLAVTHAIMESRAFARASAEKGAHILDHSVDFLWLVGCAAFLAFEAIAAVLALAIDELTPLRVAGTAAAVLACLAGVRLRCLAIESLGASFAQPPFRELAPGLASSGVFAIVRHPSELGLLLYCTGFAILVPGPIMLGAFILLLLPLAAMRIVREERWLSLALGARHRVYCMASPRLIWPRMGDFRVLFRLLARLA
jgi:protein-S-isoprenylcysteine O-methyltransferase Ste14